MNSLLMCRGGRKNNSDCTVLQHVSWNQYTRKDRRAYYTCLQTLDLISEIVERHHRRKLDAPSGTAIMLGNAANKSLNGEYHFVFDRSERREKRDPKEIGFSAVRGGTIVGVHDVIYAGEDEVIELNHQAFSRVYLQGRCPGSKVSQEKSQVYIPCAM